MVQNAQVLRFFAALSVLIGHAQHEAVDLGTGLLKEWQPIPWAFGVDIFFVISGFVMYHTASDSFGKPGAARAFFVRRLIRIVPPYWFFTALALLAALVFGEVMSISRWSAAEIFASFAFVPWPQTNGQVAPVLSLGWTLNYEMFFYAMFASCLLFPRRIGVVALFASFVAMAAVNHFVPDRWFVLKFWTDPIILEFLFGIFIALAYRRGVRVGPVAAAALVAAAIALLALYAAAGPRWVSWGVPGAMIGAAVILLPQLREGRLVQWLALAGGASYALYLSHPFSVNLVGLAWLHLFADRWPIGFVITVISAAVIASLIFYVVVERPLTSAAKRLFSRVD